MSHTILSLHPLDEARIADIRDVCPDAVIHTAKAEDCAPFLPDAEILLAFGQTDLAPLLPQAPKLRWVQSLTAGVDGFIACDAFRNSDILLTNVRGIHGIPMAEHVLGMMLASGRRLLVAHDMQAKHQWGKLRGIDEIFGKTAVVVGLGSVGRTIASRLRGMGMTLFGVKQVMTEDADVDRLYPADALYEVLPMADFVIVTLPLTPKTENLFSKKAFAAMKPSAFFINVSRGPVVNEADLVAALKDGTIGGAGLDVFCEEPLPEASPLWDAPNLILTPHHAASSPRYMERAIHVFAENLRAYPDTASMFNLIDKQRGY
ncbi:MAG: D-2-hydroxyacid dehydrogenase [Schwartzia sp.]|nr:D-2-hydroxyacid dehydrogenase [Schwartzia sp. (in: firmicutes)]